LIRIKLNIKIMKKLYLAIFLAYTITLVYSQNLNAQDGQLDPTFGNGGIVTTAINVFGNATLNAAALQSDGKVVAAGINYGIDNTGFAIARFFQNGSLDYTFGTNGIIRVKYFSRSDAEALSVAIQSDGKIIVGGYSQFEPRSSYSFFIIARYQPNGAVDSSFATDGVAYIYFHYLKNEAHSLVIQPDGKIIAAGVSNNGSVDLFAVARLNTNGDVDSTFGINGQTITAIGTSDERIHTAALQKNGKIVVAGYNNVVRYTENGTQDSTFGTNGIAYLPWLFCESMAILNDGRIIAGGYSDNQFTIACLTENGIPDSTFGTNGIKESIIGLTSEITSLRIQPDGKILAAGNAYFEAPTNFLALARYNINGDPDNDFGTNGIVTRQIGTWSNNISSVLLHPNGNIIVAGSSNYDRKYQHFSLTRFNATGNIDPSFGTNGSAEGEIGTTQSAINSIAIQSDGKIVAAGTTSVNPDRTGSNIALIRYNHDGAIDPSFGTRGIVITSIDTNSYANTVAIQSDGKIIVAGSSQDEHHEIFALARYLIIPLGQMVL
jgi:uncharacterized delta-60 repeat protein